MRPMRRLFCVLSFLLLLLSAASVAQVGNTPRPAPTPRVIAVLSAMTLEIETQGQQLTDKTEMTVQGIGTESREMEKLDRVQTPKGFNPLAPAYFGLSA